jgi:hypothetical protein
MKMAEALELEKVDEHRKPLKRLAAHLPRNPRQAKKQRVDAVEITCISDVDDENYEDVSPLGSGTSTSESDSDNMLPSNAEVCFFSLFFFCPDNGYVTCCRLRTSCHPRPSLLWGEVLLESAHTPSVRLLLWNVKTPAIPIVATKSPVTIPITRIHTIELKG